MAENELIVVEKLNSLDLFTGDAMDSIIGQIKAIVDKHVPDVSALAGRKAIASLAFKVASTKVTLDDLGKNLVADWKEKSKKVDAVRKKMRDELDALRDYARQPLTDWEKAEEAKLKQEALDREIDQAWDAAHAEQDLRERERIVREKETELAQQEAERKAKEEAERIERERKEREERIAREAGERARRQAAEAADRAKREAEAAIQREKERAERAEREKAEAEARAKAEQEAAVRRAEQRAKDEAERKERERMAAEQAEKARQEKLAANKKHQDRFDRDAIDSADMHGLPSPEAWIVAIKLGKIEHVTINY
jgi:colicin import membrane protein